MEHLFIVVIIVHMQNFPFYLQLDEIIKFKIGFVLI